MYVEVLVEDISGKKAIEILAPKLFNIPTRIHHYKGIGHIPKNMRPKTDASKRQLLNELPRLLQGFGRVSACQAVVIICDLDDRDKQAFLAELNNILESCSPKPNAIFCLAVEEFEAWYLGDINAIKQAYPRAKNNVLNAYENDTICGTWETLADAVYKGGSKDLIKKGWQEIGKQKSAWAENIAPHMNVDENLSPSFNEMRGKLQNIT
ncbi:MAG: DUF4276 family protein [Defluviitaleaceae bacterium]|nr:DUF4276 family protein [Defluviitaleaceae bacterium]